MWFDLFKLEPVDFAANHFFQNFDFIDEALDDIATELMVWVQSVASKNEKYCDVILIHNLCMSFKNSNLRMR